MPNSQYCVALLAALFFSLLALSNSDLVGSVNNIPIRHAKINKSSVLLNRNLHSLKADATTNTTNATDTSNSSNKPLKNMFVLKEFTCLDSDLGVCEMIKQTYYLATKRLSLILALDKPINLKVDWRNICSDDALNGETCGDGTLGQGSPAAFWSLDGAHNKMDENYLYPQGVVKQFMDFEEFGQFDLAVEHDSKQKDKLWFPKVVSKETHTDEEKQGKYEFEYIILHEIIHGLGMLSSLDNYFGPNKALLPPVEEDDNNSYKIKRGFIYDRYLSYKDIPQNNYISLDPLLQNMRKTAKSLNQTEKGAFEERFLGTNIGIESKRISDMSVSPMGMYYVVEKKTINALSIAKKLNLQGTMLSGYSNNENNYIMLHTPSTFVVGSSLCHFDPSLFVSTADFLMRPTLATGIFLDLPQRLNYPGLVAGAFGIGILSVINQTGYSLNLEYINSNFSTSFNNYTNIVEDPVPKSSAIDPYLNTPLFLMAVVFTF